MAPVLISRSIPAVAAAIAAGLLAFWLAGRAVSDDIEPRLPNPAVIESATTLPTTRVASVTDLRGDPVAGPGRPGSPVGAWPCFQKMELLALYFWYYGF